MEILTETPFKILHQGFADTIVEYKNIENDLPLYEQRMLENKPAEFKKVQMDFNSAELYNQELRSKYQNIPSFLISDLSNLYLTKEFKLYKINQIITVTEYLQKVLKLIFSIDKQITKLEKKIESILSEKKFNTSTEKDICRSKMVIENILDLLSDIKVSITELETDKSSIGIKPFVKEIWDTLLLSFAICYVPDEYASKIDAIFPDIALKKISFLGEEAKDKKIVSKHLSDLKNRLFFIINLFITNLSNQFSYYVTSDSFLNNPKGMTVFVIPMSMYIMFDFYQSGLTKSESVKKDPKDLYSINSKQMKFYKSVDNYLKKLLEEANRIKESILQEDEFFNIKKLLDYYEKKVSNVRIKQLEPYIADPVIFEKLTAMVQKVKITMVSSMTKGENPWDVVNLVNDTKDIDNSTIFFLLKLHEMRTDENTKFPQSQLKDLLNLCSYSTRLSTQCMNEHVSRYRKGKYRITDSYEKLFAPILMN